MQTRGQIGLYPGVTFILLSDGPIEPPDPTVLALPLLDIAPQYRLFVCPITHFLSVIPNNDLVLRYSQGRGANNFTHHTTVHNPVVRPATVASTEIQCAHKPASMPKYSSPRQHSIRTAINGVRVYHPICGRHPSFKFNSPVLWETAWPSLPFGIGSNQPEVISIWSCVLLPGPIRASYG